MDSYYTWWRFAQERHEELLGAADSARLVGRLRRRWKGRTGSVPRMAIWLGARLVSWGARLQRRYGDMPPAPPLQRTTRRQDLQLP